MKSSQNHMIVFILFLFLVFSVSFGRQESEWKGSIEKEDGVLVVKNPKEPMYRGDVFSLEEELIIASDDSNRERMFYRISRLEVDSAGNIFVCDARAGNVKVFDESGAFVKVFGRRGQGPGEFQSLAGCAFSPDQEFLTFDDRRMVFQIFDREGKFLRQTSASLLYFNGPKFLPDGALIAGFGVIDKNVTFELKIFDDEMKPAVSIASLPALKFPKVHVFVYYAALDLKWDVSSFGEIIWGAMSSPDYEFFVHNREGRRIRKITKEFSPIRLTKKEYEKLMKLWFGKVPSAGKFELVVPSHYPPIRDLIADNEGRICVVKFSEVDKRDLHYIDVFDREGRYLTEITLPGGIRFAVFRNHKLYVIDLDEEGNQTVKRFRVTWTI